MQPDWLPARPRFRLGDVVVDPHARTLAGRFGERRLSLKAMGVLTRLAAAEGEVVSRDDLLDSVWPEASVGEEVLTQAVAELRRALGDSARTPYWIETVHRSGYRLLLRASAGAPAALEPPLAGLTLDSAFDIEAYAIHLQACRAFDRGGCTGIHAAADGFSEVIGRLPGFAPAYAGLARSLAFIHMYYGPPDRHLERALRACEAGLRVDPRSHEVRAAQGIAYSAAGDAERAFASFEIAMLIRPDCAVTHYLLGRALFADGQYLAAAAIQEQAARLNPDDFHSLMLAAKAHRRLGNEQRARENLVRAMMRIEPHLQACPDDLRALCDKAYCLCELVGKDAALEFSQPLACSGDPMAYYVVGLLARAGEVSTALDTLNLIVEAGWSHLPVLRHDPDIDSLRGELRFRRIEQRLEAH